MAPIPHSLQEAQSTCRTWSSPPPLSNMLHTTGSSAAMGLWSLRIEPTLGLLMKGCFLWFVDWASWFLDLMLLQTLVAEPKLGAVSCQKHPVCCVVGVGYIVPHCTLQLPYMPHTWLAFSDWRHLTYFIILFINICGFTKWLNQKMIKESNDTDVFIYCESNFLFLL